MNKPVCIVPWVHMHVYPNGSVTPCCVWPATSPISNITEGSLINIAESKPVNDIRRSIMNGIFPKHCSQCVSEDGTTSKALSLREIINTEFKDQIDSLLANTNTDGSLKNSFRMQYMNIRYSNLCNYSCRTCGPYHSSAIAEANNIGNPIKKITNIVPNYLTDIYSQLSNVKFVNFAGGESVLIPEHWDVLDRLKELEKTDTKINYISNLSKLTYKNKNLIEYIKDFPNFTLSGSIDASHERGEYLRYGTNWRNVEQNLKQIRDNEINFSIHCTVSAYNVWHVPDLHRYLLSNDYVISDKFIINQLVSPKHLSVKILPNWYKEIVSKKIDEHISWLIKNNIRANSWQKLITHMLQDDHSEFLQKFKTFNQELDIRHSKNLVEVFTELRGIFSDY